MSKGKYSAHSVMSLELIKEGLQRDFDALREEYAKKNNPIVAGLIHGKLLELADQIGEADAELAARNPGN